MRFSMPHALLAAVAAVGLMAFQDTTDAVSIDFPPDWEATAGAGEGIHAVKQPNDGGSGANCLIQSNSVPALASMTQEQINADMAQPMDAAGWASFIGQDPSTLKVSNTEVVDVDGKRQQIATLVMADGQGGSVTSRFSFIPAPGRVVNAACFARTDHFDGYAELFDKTVRSARAL